MYNKKQTVFIRILGEQGTGKTCMGFKIGKILAAHGINSRFYEYNDDNTDIDETTINRNLNSLSERVDVIIQTEHMKEHNI